jgi:hypothetical protein
MPSPTLTRITGTVRKGAYGNFNGWVRVKPDAPILSNAVNFNLVVLGIGEKSPIIDSQINFEAVASPDVTYFLEIGSDVLISAEVPQVLNTDGSVRTAFVAAVYREEIYLSWHSLIPPLALITLDMLLPIQIQTGNIDQSFFRVANILKANPEFRALLLDIFRPMGVWVNTTYYKKFDFVSHTIGAVAKTYICTSPIPSGGQTPNIDTVHWQLFAG